MGNWLNKIKIIGFFVFSLILISFSASFLSSVISTALFLLFYVAVPVYFTMYLSKTTPLDSLLWYSLSLATVCVLSFAFVVLPILKGGDYIQSFMISLFFLLVATISCLLIVRLTHMAYEHLKAPAQFIQAKKYLSFRNILIAEALFLVVVLYTQNFFGLVIEKQVPLNVYMEYLHLEEKYNGEGEISVLDKCYVNDTVIYRVAGSESGLREFYLFYENGDEFYHYLLYMSDCKGGHDCIAGYPETTNCTLIDGDRYEYQ